MSIAAAVTLAGLALDLVFGGRGMPAPAYPDSAASACFFVAITTGVYLSVRKRPIAAVLGGRHLAITTLIVLLIWGALLGYFPQVDTQPAGPIYQRVLRAPPFVFALLLLVANLWWGVLHRLGKRLDASALFLVNHLGVAVTLGAGLFGTGDLIRMDVWVGKNDLVWYGTERGHPRELPFAIHLHEFDVEFYPPELRQIDPTTGAYTEMAGAPPIPLEPGSSGQIGNSHVEVLDWSADAPWSSPDDAVPAARIRISTPGGDPAEGWISSGSKLAPPMFMPFGDQVLAMSEPRPKRYLSQMTIVREGFEPMEASVEVNKPLRVAGWWLYQKGYRPNPSGPGYLSQIEAVRDPWLPFVYTGFGMMAAGSLLGFARAGQILRNRQIQQVSAKPIPSQAP